MGNMVVVMLTAKFTGTVITFTNIDCKSDDSARKLHSLVCTCVTNKVMALPVNFDQFLQLTFTEIKLTITRGGILGEGRLQTLHRFKMIDLDGKIWKKKQVEWQIICFLLSSSRVSGFARVNLYQKIKFNSTAS